MLTNINWYLTSYVKIAQTYGCSIGISELGDLGGSAQIAWKDWIPNHFVPYFNTLKTLSPPVPIEYFALFDINTAAPTNSPTAISRPIARVAALYRTRRRRLDPDHDGCRALMLDIER